jgi:putative endonuclease
VPEPRRPTLASARRLVGALGERFAAEHYERLGYTVLDRNYRTRWGELDLIVADAQTLVFAEVKAASQRASVAPLERLGGHKQRRVRQIAAAWMCEPRDRPWFSAVRFDAVAVTVDESGGLVALDHLEDAF